MAKYLVELTEEQFQFVSDQMINFANGCAAVGRREREEAPKVLAALRTAKKTEE